MFLIDISACCQSFINLRLIQRLILKKFTNLSITPRMYHGMMEANTMNVCVDSLRPSQQFFSYVGMGLPGLNQY